MTPSNNQMEELMKTQLTIAISSIIGATIALTSTQAQAIQVYKDDQTKIAFGGRVEPRFNVSNANDGNFEDKSRIRLNAKLKHTLNETVTAFAKYEIQFKVKDDEFETRYAYAGVDIKDIGAFSYGKSDSAQTDIGDFTDILDTFGNEAFNLVQGNKKRRERNFLYSRESEYVHIQANYVASDAEDDDGENNDSYGTSIILQPMKNLSLAAGYVDGQQWDDDDEQNFMVDVDQYNLGIAYEINDLYLGATYSRANLDKSSEVFSEDRRSYEAAMQYSIKQWDIRAVYNLRQDDDGSGYEDKKDETTLEVSYTMFKGLNTYAGYKFNNKSGKDNELQAGIKYKF